jgi:HEAT repeat protein
VAIQASSARQIDRLLDDLRAAHASTRDAAVARLTVIGARAVERLVALAESDADRPARAHAFKTLEAIGDARALDPAMHALDDADADVAIAAAGVARLFVRGARGATAIDRLTATALDGARPDAVRLAALRSLRDLDGSTIAPLLKTLAADASAAVREEARRRDNAADSGDVLARAADLSLDDDAAAVRHAIADAGRTAPLLLLLKIIERVRERETTESAARRAEWMTARAAAHLALAERGSRLALYDLRESLNGTARLPVEFVAALSLVGDAGCLEAIAGAYARASEAGRARDDWWRQHLAGAFVTIARREKITRRHAVMKRIVKRWPPALNEIWAGEADRAGKAGR